MSLASFTFSLVPLFSHIYPVYIHIHKYIYTLNIFIKISIYMNTCIYMYIYKAFATTRITVKMRRARYRSTTDAIPYLKYSCTHRGSQFLCHDTCTTHLQQPNNKKKFYFIKLSAIFHPQNNFKYYKIYIFLFYYYF